MNNLIVQPGSWSTINSAVVEAFFAVLCKPMGLTEEQREFLRKIHNDIHGRYKPEPEFFKMIESLIELPPSFILGEISKTCDTAHKKQVLSWFNEFKNLESVKNFALYDYCIAPMDVALKKLAQ